MPPQIVCTDQFMLVRQWKKRFLEIKNSFRRLWKTTNRGQRPLKIGRRPVKIGRRPKKHGRRQKKHGQRPKSRAEDQTSCLRPKIWIIFLGQKYAPNTQPKCCFGSMVTFELCFELNPRWNSSHEGYLKLALLPGAGGASFDVLFYAHCPNIAWLLAKRVKKRLFTVIFNKPSKTALIQRLYWKRWSSLWIFWNIHTNHGKVSKYPYMLGAHANTLSSGPRKVFCLLRRQKTFETRCPGPKIWIIFLGQKCTPAMLFWPPANIQGPPANL